MIKIFVFLFCLFFSFPAYAAVNTSSNADLADMDNEVFYDGYDNNTLSDIYSEVLAISDLLSEFVSPDSSDQELQGVEGNTFAAETPVLIDALDAESGQALSEDVYVNVIRYDVTFNGDSFILLFPPESIDSLYIDSQNRLWNMSNSTITGRAVSAQFDPLAEEGDLFYLTPCLGNNFSTVESYGSPNYVRSYYWSSGRLVYNTTYGTIYVEKYYNPFYVSQSLDYILLFSVLGGVLFLCLSSFKHY